MGLMLSRICIVLFNTAFQYLRCLVKDSPWSLWDCERIWIYLFISNVNFEALLLKIPVWIFSLYDVNLLNLAWLSTWKEDPVSSARKPCSSMLQLLHTRISAVAENPLPWTGFCCPVRCDSSLGSSTLTDSGRIWP